jgi:hypothetical protein
MKDGVFIYYSNRRTYESAGRYEKEQAVENGRIFIGMARFEVKFSMTTILLPPVYLIL